MNISYCRAFSPFKTLPGCRVFRHSVIKSKVITFLTQKKQFSLAVSLHSELSLTAVCILYLQHSAFVPGLQSAFSTDQNQNDRLHDSMALLSKVFPTSSCFVAGFQVISVASSFTASYFVTVPLFNINSVADCFPLSPCSVADRYTPSCFIRAVGC